MLSLIASLYVSGGCWLLKPSIDERPRTTANCSDALERMMTPPPPRSPLYAHLWLLRAYPCDSDMGDGDWFIRMCREWYLKIHELSYCYYGLLALVVALIAGIGVSACTGARYLLVLYTNKYLNHRWASNDNDNDVI